jgi:hypothetical protein
MAVGRMSAGVFVAERDYSIDTPVGYRAHRSSGAGQTRDVFLPPQNSIRSIDFSS